MNKANLLKYAPAGVVVAAAAAACGLGGYIIAQWPAIDAAIKPAIVSGALPKSVILRRPRAAKSVGLLPTRQVSRR